MIEFLDWIPPVFWFILAPPAIALLFWSTVIRYARRWILDRRISRIREEERR